jgi:hypothetical protein
MLRYMLSSKQIKYPFGLESTNYAVEHLLREYILQ